MATCGIKITDLPALPIIESLKGYYKNNINRLIQSALLIMNEDMSDFNSEFIEFYKNKYNLKTNPIFKSANASVIKKITEAIVEYTNNKFPQASNVNIETRNSIDAYLHNYSESAARDEGKVHVSHIILSEFKRLKENNKGIKGNELVYYINTVRKVWLNLIFAKASLLSDKSIETFKEEYNALENNDAKKEYINNILGGKNKTEANTNMYSVYLELNSDSQHTQEYVLGLFNDPLLNKVLKDISRDADEIQSQIDAESNAAINGTTAVDMEDALVDLDESVALYDHSGIKDDFNKHISDTIRVYFDTLPVLNSNNVTDYDVNNLFELPAMMSSKECIRFLISINEDFKDITSMIKAIRKASERIQRFKAFTKFARDLEADFNFANAVFSTFARPKYNSVEVRVKGTKTSVVNSNPRVNRESALTFDFITDIKSSINQNDYQSMSSVVEDLNTILTDLKNDFSILRNSNLTEKDKLTKEKSFKDNKEKFIIKATQLIKAYFPSVELDSIRAYIELNNNANTNEKEFINNCINLFLDIKTTVDESKNSKEAFDKMEADLKSIRSYNKNLDLQKAKRKDVWISKDKYLDENSVLNEDFIEGQIPAIRSLVKKLLPYSITSIRLNGRNIYGNNQSAVLNSSWISGIKHMTETFYKDELGRLRNDELEKWGENKLLKTSQYRYSTLLVEQTDENGNVLNPNTALFKIVDDKVLLTENADKVLKVYLFNGSSNIDEGSNMDYTKMTKPDFFPSSYMMFFNTKDITSPGTNFATYFLKTPSDAPNAFTIRSIRNDASNLVIVANPDKINSDIEEIINSTVSLIDSETFLKDYANEDENISAEDMFAKLEDRYLSSLLTNPRNQIITNNKAIRYTSPVKDNGKRNGYVTYITKEGIILIYKGEFAIKDNQTRIYNPELVGVVNKNFIQKVAYNNVPDTIHNILYDYYRHKLELKPVNVNGKWYNKVEYKINTDTPIYKMIRNQFKQEVLDGAIAISTYFKLKKLSNGNYVVDKEKTKDGIWHPIKSAEADLSRGYTNYHIKGNSVITYDDGSLTYELTGDVFKFMNFTLTIKDKDGKATTKNYFEHLLDTNQEGVDKSKINFLYGGAMQLVCDKDGNVIDVVFNDAQLANIDKAMSEYLMDYFSQVTDMVTANSKFIKNTPMTKAAIADYAANTLLMMFNYDYLFDGSPKFYKSNQDVIKRVKQYQGSGVPYGSANYTSTFTPNVDIAENSFLNDGYIEEHVIKTVIENGKKVKKQELDDNGKPKVNKIYIRDIIDKYPALKGLRQRNGFYAVTIENTRRTNVKALEILEDVLMNKAGLSTEQAKTLLWGEVELDDKGKPKIKDGMPVRKGGFQDTKVNDAQSYITIEEFIRRLSAKGQLKRYLPLIEKLMDESKPISAEEISEFIQVQKNFYFDMWYDERYHIEVTRQIKNAEFVLIPRFIKGTQLARVYEAMKAAGIDQLNTLETSKAANEKVLKIWDNDGNFDEDTINTFISEAQKERQIYSYNNLYTQQETPQHMDAENKAGIQIMKKMLDNIPSSGHYLSILKNEFFKVYSQNINEGCAKLLKRLEIPIDQNGNLELDEDGNIKGINLKVLYNRLLEEARRTGVDDNQKDYFEINEDTGLPYMPSYNNNFLKKFQSVFQSMFNSSVTRQKLPGFHAAQVTNIGFKSYGDEKFDVSYSKELEYHPNGEPFIQVMIPYKALGIDKNSKHYKGMSDAAILNELKAKGLLDFIGYRIPTEGKQSIAIMRVVGFLDDSQGSTIIVPDDWVSQTGSDFDIDSIYTILHEHEVDRYGEVHKIEYKEHRTEQDWKKYVDTYKPTDDSYSSQEIKETRKRVAKLQNDLIEELKEKEVEAYNALPDKIKSIIKTINTLVDKQQKDKDLTKLESFTDRLQTIVDYLNNYPPTEKITQLKEFRDINVDLLDKLINKDDNYYKEVAKEFGLLSLKDYIDPVNTLIANTKKQRNSRIVDIFLDILRDPSSLEENLSRSNFDKITKAKLAKMNPNIRIEREGRNPHNIIDQVSYQEEVMSGRTLKGMSVALDTMCSVCNTVRPTLEEEIHVIYNSNEIDANIAGEAYDVDVNDKKKQISVHHNTYGWSKNNKNITGDFITTYSSQTTAYILDAVKEGSIPNLNIHTFPVLKTLANVGIDYGTSIAFIMQPGISEIVSIQNSNNSVFEKGYQNEINDAIINLAHKHGIFAKTANEVLKYINDNYKKELNALFKTTNDDVKLGTTDATISKLPIISKLLDDRLFRKGKFKKEDSINNLIFDIATILIYSRINRIAGRISTIASCCNPDKFGAKQTVYSTRKMFDKIDNAIFKTELAWHKDDKGNIVYSKEKKLRKPILSVNGKHILEAIYPGVSDETASKNQIIDNIVKNDYSRVSAYPPLYAFLKYATATSTVIAREVFDTEDPVFTDIVEGLGQYFSGADKELSEEAYIDFQKYLLSSMYKKIPSIRYAIHVAKEDGKVKMYYTHTDDQNNPNIEDKVAAQNETSRIFGFGHSTDFGFFGEEEYLTKSGETKTRSVYKTVKVKNINNPTVDEIADFEQLSPAQKVKFLQTYLYNAGLFNLLKASLFNTESRGRWQGVQTIEFIDEATSNNEVYRLFKRAFESDNPLVVSTAIDIVKYGVQVEGLGMSANAVNKVIDNDCLINDFNENGLGFVTDMRRQMREFGTINSETGNYAGVMETYENYLRSLPKDVTIRTLYLSAKNKEQFNIYPVAYGILVFKASNESEDETENATAFNKLLIKAGIKYNTISEEKYGVNAYIKINDPKKGLMLYKIHDFGNNVILTPLTKLEPNENAVWSAKVSNNVTYLSPYGYEKIIAEYAGADANTEFNKDYFKNALDNLEKETKNVSDIRFVEKVNKLQHPANLDFNVENLVKEGSGAAISLKQAIINHFTDIASEPLFVDNILIGSNIYTPSVAYGSTQKIVFPNGDKHNFVIAIPKTIDSLERVYLRPKKDTEPANVDTIPYSTLKPIVEAHQNAKDKHMSNLGIIIQVDDIIDDSDEAYNATIEDKMVDIIDMGERLFSTSDKASELFNITGKFKNSLRAFDITPNVESVTNNKLHSIREISSFIIRTSSYIRNELFDKFIEDPESDDIYIPITDPRIQDIVKNDARYMEKYMLAVNFAKDFLDKAEVFTSEVSEDTQIQSYIDDIKSALAKNLQGLPIDRLIEDLGNTILKAKSTNPLVQQNFLKVMDGYYRTYGSMWQYHSIMENGTPILQTILSDVMVDLDAKEKSKHRILKKYRDRLKEIQDRAAARGEKIDLSHIIDKDGNWVAPYLAEFVIKLHDLKDEVSKYAPGTIDHIRAKLAYDKFKADHVNQEAKDIYYQTKLRIEQRLFDNIPELYSKYMELFYQRSAIYDYARKEDLSDDDVRKLQDIEAEMYNLYRENEYINEAGEPVLRPDVNPSATYTQEQKLDLRLHSNESANLLAQSLKELEAIREATFEQEAVRGFQRTLKANQALIARLERRINGVPTVSAAVLAQNPDYVKAVSWIRNNAYFSFTDDPNGIGAKLKRALHLIGRRGNGHVQNDILKDKSLKDAKGVIDGRKLTDEQLRSLKASEEVSMRSPRGDINEQAIDRILITNRKPDNVIFNNAFYHRLSSNGERNISYYQIVTELNKLLEPYVGPIDGYIHFEWIKDDAEGLEIIRKIGDLYNTLAQTNSHRNATNNAEISRFLGTDAEIVTNTELFKQQVKAIANKSQEFKEAMMRIFYVADSDGEYRKDNEGNFIPNRFLYSYIKPKGQPGERSYDQYVNSEERAARALVDEYYESVTTEYYEYSKEEAIKNGTYDEWFDKNHYYNCYTRRMEPLSCWVTRRIRPEYFANNELEGKWMPKSKQATRKVRDGKIKAEINGTIYEIDDPEHEDMTNHDYKPNASNAENYKIGSGYDSNIELNQSEREMRDFLKEVLNSTAKTNAAKRYLETSLPHQAKPEPNVQKQLVKEIVKSFGVGLGNNNGYSRFRADSEIGFAYDEAPTMPMLHNLDNKVTIDLERQLKELKDNKPQQEDNERWDDYQARLQPYNESVKELEEKIRDERRALLDNDWYTIIENYLSAASDYNAILDNKNKLYFLLNVLKDMKMHTRKYGSYGSISKASVDENLLKQYKDFMRRLLFDEWKEPEGKATSFGNFLQGYASANYMMLNVKGGVANVTLGATGMLAEAAAKDYFGWKDWGFASKEYTIGIPSYGASLYHYATTGRRRAFSKQGAIIDYCNVVDYDEVQGVIRNVNISHYSEQIRNFMFSPQSAGEHMMQNTALFAILHSHKIIETKQGLIPMNKSQYIGYKQYKLLTEILDEEQMAKFEEFKEKIKNDKDALAKLAWFRQEALSKFIYIECTKEQQKEFKVKRKEQQKRLEAEFDSKPDIYSQLELKDDGTMGFVANSELDRLDRIKANTLGNVTEAVLLMAKISEKTRHINNKIHGIYNKKEAAYIERKWYGGLIMQYHKHIPMGLLKRYMARGHWNEFRQSVDKGMVQSVMDLTSLNLEKVKKDCNFTDEETNALKSFIFQLTHVHKILGQLKATWEIMPEYDRANIARNLGDLLGVVSALATTAALWAIAEDDDLDGYWFNFFLYESDRLASEAFMWNPYGMINEGKKLMSTPVAAMSIITDAFNTVVGIGNYIMNDEYDPYYHTGIHAGEHRLGVYVQRRIPVWSAIESIIDLPNNNHVYKLGENAVSLLDVKELVRGK